MCVIYSCGINTRNFAVRPLGSFIPLTAKFISIDSLSKNNTQYLCLVLEHAKQNVAHPLAVESWPNLLRYGLMLAEESVPEREIHKAGLSI